MAWRMDFLLSPSSEMTSRSRKRVFSKSNLVLSCSAGVLGFVRIIFIMHLGI